MTPLIENRPLQDPRNLGTHLGVLAAQNASPRLSAILQRLRDRAQAREQATAKFRATHFILAD